MYSSEYKWTSEETKKTTISIVTESESKRKTHSMFKISTDIQLIGSTIKR